MSDNLRYSLIFALLGAVFFTTFLGGVHLFDWDEINFAEISREMLITGDLTRVYVNFEPFYQKPPFFFWLQALSMALFGFGEYAARFPNALCGILTLVLLFNIGRRLYDTRFGIIWAGAYLGSVLPFLYFKSGIIDPWFNLFIFLGLYLLILFTWKKEGLSGIKLPRGRWSYLFWAGFFVGMGILTKGQVAYLIVVLTMGVYWIYQRFRLYISIPQFIFFTLAATLVTLTWYGLETLQNGPSFVIEFNKYQYKLFSTPDAGHSGFPGYHFVVLLVGCFPASVFAIRAFRGLPEDSHPYQRDFRIWMKFLFWVVLILFTIVRSKIVHYSSMCYFPLTFLAAVVINHMVHGRIAYQRWMGALLIAIGGLFITAVFITPFVGWNIDMLRPLFKSDPFAQGNLEAQVRWTGWEALPALLLAAVLFLSLRWIRRRQGARGFEVLFGGTAVFVLLTLIFFIKRIEGYSQRAAVEFFTEKAGEDCYLTTYGYKSYVPMFYGRPTDAGKCCFSDPECPPRLINGPVDKPAYIVTKVMEAPQLANIPGLTEIGRKNGFVFFRRDPDR